jgi:hypothetical protein
MSAVYGLEAENISMEFHSHIHIGRGGFPDEFAAKKEAGDYESVSNFSFSFSAANPRQLRILTCRKRGAGISGHFRGHYGKRLLAGKNTFSQIGIFMSMKTITWPNLRANLKIRFLNSTSEIM